MNAIDSLDEKLETIDNSVLGAVRRNEWSSLRALSLRPGGFGNDRKHAWPFLLHVEQSTDVVKKEEDRSTSLRRRRRSSTSMVSESEKGSDESKSAAESLSLQAEVSHPDEHQIKLDTDRSFVLYSVDGGKDREQLQSELNEFIMSVFRLYPGLSYFQGYHDIITVLFLTLPESDQLPCAEKMSLHRLRDAMGKGLEPLLGLLQILRYLLRLADPQYAALLERNTPLPYFALSNLLTLFSHDVPTLPLIQHVFDFLLCRPPVAIVYLAAAVTLSRKDEAFKMEQEGEEGMLHSLLSSLPELCDGDHKDGPWHKTEDTIILQEEHLNPSSALCEANSECVEFAPPIMKVEDTVTDLPCAKEVEVPNWGDATNSQSVAAHSSVLPHESPNHLEPEGTRHVRTVSEYSVRTDESATVPGSSIVSDLSSSDLRSSEAPEPDASSRPASPQWHASSEHTARLRVSLPALLERVDTLLEQYPPSHPALHVSAIMGPQSVIFTWTEDPHCLMSDAEAEAVTAHPELIVLPFVDPDEEAAMKEAARAADTSTDGRIRRKLRKRFHRKNFGVRLDKKTVLTGTVVALSVAVAVYSMRSKGNAGIPDISKSGRTMRKTARAVSGLLIGGSERLLETFGW